MLPISDEISDYLAAGIPGITIAVQRVSDLAYSVHAMAASGNGDVSASDTYTIQVDLDTSDRLPAFEVLDADGDPIKNLFPTWQDAADTVIAALSPPKTSGFGG